MFKRLAQKIIKIFAPQVVTVVAVSNTENVPVVKVKKTKSQKREILPLSVFKEDGRVYVVCKKQSGKLFYYTGSIGENNFQKGAEINIKTTKAHTQLGQVIAFSATLHNVRKGEKAYMVRTILRKEERTFIVSGKNIEQLTIRKDVSSLPAELVIAKGYMHDSNYVGYFNDENGISAALIKDFKKVFYVRDVLGNDSIAYADGVLPIVVDVAYSTSSLFVLLDLSYKENNNTYIRLSGAFFDKDYPVNIKSINTLYPLYEMVFENADIRIFGLVEEGGKYFAYAYDMDTGRMFAILVYIPELSVKDSKYKNIVRKPHHNPILHPLPTSDFEGSAVLNPAAILLDDTTHLIYRAVGHDGVSRLGYAKSDDGVSFSGRSKYPVFALLDECKDVNEKDKKYDLRMYPSGGSYGGVEDPRMVKIDGRIYVSFNAFSGWEAIRIGVISISEEDFLANKWNWSKPKYISPEREVNKNWVLFPEKINGKFAVLHNIWPKIGIVYVDTLEELENGSTIVPKYWHRGGKYGAMPSDWILVHEGTPGFQWVDPKVLNESQWVLGGRNWDTWIRSAGPSPVLTDKGWLVLYHAMDKREPHIGYKIGALILDKDNPEKIIGRATAPILEPEMWYENDWKPGVAYSCGAVVKDGEIYIYYGGGDKYVCVAVANLDELVSSILSDHDDDFLL